MIKGWIFCSCVFERDLIFWSVASCWQILGGGTVDSGIRGFQLIQNKIIFSSVSFFLLLSCLILDLRLYITILENSDVRIFIALVVMWFGM